MKKQYKTIFLLPIALIVIPFSIFFEAKALSTNESGPCAEAAESGVCVGSGESCKIGNGGWITIQCGKDKGGAAIEIEFE
tara:strand:- start:9549 stop:9788 length:240 start_codon:yes stop_codon:yes gene_type:complete